MKVSVYALALLAAVSAALPTADPEAGPEPIPDVDIAAIDLASLNAAQCKAACRAGSTAMERVCRVIPFPHIRAICWGIAAGVRTPAGMRACIVFCDAFF